MEDGVEGRGPAEAPALVVVTPTATLEAVYLDNYPRLVGLGPLRYVRSAVINLCRNRFRRKVVPLRPAVAEPSAEWTAASNARRDEVLAALATLPTRQREVVALRYFGGLSAAETAHELSIAEGTVKVHLHRGLAALREQLEDQRHD